MARRLWFKHFGTSSDGATLRALWDSNDFEAYGLWWRLLEMMCRFEDETRPGTMTISLCTISRETGWKPSKCLRVLIRICSVSKIELEEKPDGIYTFLVPKWSELNSSWGGKREASSEQDAGRSKKLEVRSKNISTEGSQNDPCGAITELSGNSIVDHFLSRIRIKAQQGWIELYGNPDWIKQEVIKAHNWIQTNPHRAPKKDFGRFMNSWLSRAWEQHRKNLPSNYQPTKVKSVEEALKEA